MKKRIFSLWMPVVVWSGLIFYLSSLRIKPPTGTWLDIVLPYLVHLGEYGILFTLTWRASKNRWVSFIFVIFYALFDEFHQAFVPTRKADPLDFLVDICGMILAYLAIWKFLAKAPEKLKAWAKSWQII